MTEQAWDFDIDGVQEHFQSRGLAHAEEVDGGWRFMCPTCGNTGDVYESRIFALQEAAAHHLHHIPIRQRAEVS